MSQPQVLIIDDETGSRESMALAIEKTGLAVKTFDDARRALEYLEGNPAPRLALCDLRMPGMDGLAFLQEVRQRELDLGVVLITAYGSIESAVEAMRVGADDYLTKPVDLYELRKRVANLLENRRLKEEVSSLRAMLDKRYGFESIIGHSAPMERLFEQMRLVAPTRSSVLIVGESGTGKELVASALHRASPRRDQRFLAINCGAIPSDILESELFGHERGSFTGAVARKIGKFELAHKGTLFLDEISELYPELQVKLLRVLEERQIMRVGGSDLIEVDFRLIAATNRDLENEVAEGRFREDLYYRLKVVTLAIPPLRQRGSDVALLAEHYLAELCAEHGKPPIRLAPGALEAMTRYEWPGNVRQLKNVLESLVIFQQGGIDVHDLPAEIRQQGGAAPAGEGPIQASDGRARTMEEIERQAILETLRRTGGHRARAASLLGIGLRTLQRKLKDYKEQGLWED
ncbi:MAG TPA: sigma-54 dependent transcriptional regulator [Thermoanaerobaculia bacterium]|nr:sigma-54 dependent transcriptional regulator [Thermoanaerobaculia bacterium]